MLFVMLLSLARADFNFVYEGYQSTKGGCTPPAQGADYCSVSSCLYATMSITVRSASKESCQSWEVGGETGKFKYQVVDGRDDQVRSFIYFDDNDASACENGEEAHRVWLFTSGNCGNTANGACERNVDGSNTSCDDIAFIYKKADFTVSYAEVTSSSSRRRLNTADSVKTDITTYFDDNGVSYQDSDIVVSDCSDKYCILAHGVSNANLHAAAAASEGTNSSSRAVSTYIAVLFGILSALFA